MGHHEDCQGWQDLEPLTADNLVDEIAGLYEDLENWDHGHPMIGTQETLPM